MKWKETKFKKFLDKAGDAIKENGGDVLNIAAMAATGNIAGAIATTVGMIDGDKHPELKDELVRSIDEFELEMYRLEVEDRDSARNREIEIKKAGGQDIMMIVTGAVGLLAFLVIIFTVLFISLPEQNENLAHQIIGLTEGVAISIFAYYFGSSKGSKDKDKK